MGFRVWGLGFRVWGLGFRVWGLGFRVWGLAFRVEGLGFRAPLSNSWIILILWLYVALNRTPNTQAVLKIMSPLLGLGMSGLGFRWVVLKIMALWVIDYRSYFGT